MTQSRCATRCLFAAAALSLGVAISGTAAALPSAGATVPSARVADPDGHVVDTGALRGKVAIVLYEDPRSAGQNRALVDELYARASVLQRGAPVAVVPVADLSQYSFWPVKSVAERTVRARASKAGVRIYCDWNGGFRARLGLERGKSNVLLIDRDGEIVFSAAGTLTPEQRETFFSLATSELGARQASNDR